MILVGLDDTDTADTPGTNHLARELAALVAPDWRCERIVRHQLLVDPRVPYTSHNGSASMRFVPRAVGAQVAELVRALRNGMRERFVPGSDPGLCAAETVPGAVARFGRRCKEEVVAQEEARRLAAECGLHLEGLGGTEGGVIGALAAVGLAATGEDGRVVAWGGRTDELSGPQPFEVVLARGVDEVRRADTGAPAAAGLVDVGKKLRPNLRGGRVVLFVEAAPDLGPGAWRAVRRD